MARRKKSGRHSKKRATQTIQVPALIAKSSRTNIHHAFAIPESWENTIALLAAAYQGRINQDLLKAIPFWNWIQQQPDPDPSCVVRRSDPLYRIVYGGRDPLSVEGSLASGGRYNVGGAQQIQVAGVASIEMQPALYAADTIDCAKAEAGQFLGLAEIYKLSHAGMTLWDMEKILEFYSWPDLRTLVEGEPFNKLWGLQKSPAISQLLGAKLRGKVQGILSRSTKLSGGSVVTVFVKDGNHCRQMFSAERVS